ncbi:MAG: hypothetical protein BM558_05475 [Roseobacter sp. MedPE-SW]|nr:MAG: hypothetical protein BM558_05475 [Roseobacter sp. MedPE-SW]
MLNLLYRPFLLPAFCLAALLAPMQPVFSHEFWIEPEKYQVNSDDSLKAGLRNGQLFKGARLPYFNHSIRRFDTVQNGEVTPYKGRMGDRPALTLADLTPGLLVALHETTPDLITYETWDKFASFAQTQGFGDIQRRHQARGLPESGFGEYYTRHAKLLVSVDHGQGSDRAFGLETELVALQNPYTLMVPDANYPAILPVQLLYQTLPRPHTQVEVFERSPDDSVQRHLFHTDATGVVQIPVRSQHRYLLNSVVLRPLEGEEKAVWETLWASLVFAIP